MYSYSFYFQVVMILALIAVVVWKGKFSRVFTAITGCFYLLYAVIQNMAVTEQHGFSMVTVNVAMIGFVALVWLWAAWKGNNEFSFDNVTENRLDDTCCSVLFVVADESENGIAGFSVALFV